MQLIISEAKARDETIRFSAYRTEAGAEVDFILEKKEAVFAIEVKATKKVVSTDLRGLKSFIDFHGKRCHALMIYLGEQSLNIDGFDVLPVIEAMKFLGY